MAASDALSPNSSPTSPCCVPAGITEHGRGALRALIEADVDAGVRQTPTRVLASGAVTVVEALFINPPENPDHCPPAMAFIVFERDHRARRLHFRLAPRFSEDAD